MVYIRFNAELNGLQTGVKFFLAIDFSPTHLIKILQNGAIFRLKNLMSFDILASILRSKENTVYTIL